MAVFKHGFVCTLIIICGNLSLVKAKGLWKRDDSDGLDACSTFSFATSYCESVSPGFDDYSPASQAPCLCYSSTDWEPNGFDDPVSICEDYLYSADDSEALLTVANFDSFCSSVGPVLGAAATSGAAASSTPLTAAPASTPSKKMASPTLASASPTFNLGPGAVTNSPDPTVAPAACTIIASVISLCNELTPGFTDLDATSQASCLCYSSTSWVPQLFDGNVATCAKQLSTVDPTDVSVVTPFFSFCESVGDITTAVPATGAPSFHVLGPVSNTPKTPGPVSTTVTPSTASTAGPVASQQSGAARSNRVSVSFRGLLVLYTDLINQANWALLGLLGTLFV